MRDRIRIALIMATLACSPLFLGCGGGGGSQPVPPPPPAPTPPDAPTGLRVQLETRASESGGYTYFHVTWLPSPGSITHYELMVTHPPNILPGPDVSTIVSINTPDPLSAWIRKDGPELSTTTFKVRAQDKNTALFSSWSPLVSGVVPPWPPDADAIDDSNGAPPRSIKLTIQKRSEKADAVRIYRAEGDMSTHTPWQPLLDLNYGTASTLQYLDQAVMETHSYVYMARNLAAGVEGDPGSSSSAYIYLFNPDPIPVNPVTDRCPPNWTPRSLAGLSQDLFRADFGFQGASPPIGNHLAGAGSMGLSSWKDVPYQSGFFAYYVVTRGATTQRFSDVYPCRYLGPDAWPAATEALSAVPFPYGIPGGRPSGPWYWFLGVDDHLEVYTWKNGTWATDSFRKVDGIVHPGVRLGSEGNPYFF